MPVGVDLVATGEGDEQPLPSSRLNITRARTFEKTDGRQLISPAALWPRLRDGQASLTSE